MNKNIMNFNLPRVTDEAFEFLFYVKEEIESSTNQYCLNEINDLLKEMIKLDNDIEKFEGSDDFISFDVLDTDTSSSKYDLIDYDRVQANIDGCGMSLGFTLEELNLNEDLETTWLKQRVESLIKLTYSLYEKFEELERKEVTKKLNALFNTMSTSKLNKLYDLMSYIYKPIKGQTSKMQHKKIDREDIHPIPFKERKKFFNSLGRNAIRVNPLMDPGGLFKYGTRREFDE